jgi:hypothetical protein
MLESKERGAENTLQVPDYNFYVWPTFYFRCVITILCMFIMLAYSEKTWMASKGVGDGDKSWWGEDRQDVQGI